MEKEEEILIKIKTLDNEININIRKNATLSSPFKFFIIPFHGGVTVTTTPTLGVLCTAAAPGFAKNLYIGV